MCRFCARGANVTTRRARARARGWGGHVLTYGEFICGKSWVSNFRDPPNFVSWVSNVLHQESIELATFFPKRSATVPLDRRDGDDEVTRF